jgi:dolichyl-phosphate-mannose--protein O-mannosyl transferase
MEQLFGLIMGLGVGLVFLRRLRPKLAPPDEDQCGGNLNTIGLLFLLIIMMWDNLHKNVINWAKGKHIPEHLFGIPAQWWFMIVGLVLSAIILTAIIRRRRKDLPLAPSSGFGRGQLLFLIILWIAIAGAFTQTLPGMARKGAFFVHVTFWITGGICSLIVLVLSDKTRPISKEQIAASDQSWKLSLRTWISWLLVPVLIFLLAYLTISSHNEELSGSQLRFTKNAQQ